MRSAVIPGALALAPAGESSPRVREYFDFGVGVDVEPPCRVEPEASTTLAPDKGQQPRCIEEGL